MVLARSDLMVFQNCPNYCADTGLVSCWQQYTASSDDFRLQVFMVACFFVSFFFFLMKGLWSGLFKKSTILCGIWSLIQEVMMTMMTNASKHG